MSKFKPGDGVKVVTPRSGWFSRVGIVAEVAGDGFRVTGLDTEPLTFFQSELEPAESNTNGGAES